MRANELRIGNYYSNNGSINTVTPNTIEEVWNAERVWCKPIPLTEEWLLRFGFEKLNKKWRLKNGYHWIEVDLCSFYINRNQITIIEHVHQLQNLYFALTNEELTLQS